VSIQQAIEVVITEQKSRIDAIMVDTLKLARQQIILYVNEQRKVCRVYCISDNYYY